MSPRKFYELVKEMREAQKSYFATRRNKTLVQAKLLEKHVDVFIAETEIEIANRNKETYRQFVDKAVAYLTEHREILGETEGKTVSCGWITGKYVDDFREKMEEGL